MATPYIIKSENGVPIGKAVEGNDGSVQVHIPGQGSTRYDTLAAAKAAVGGTWTPATA